MTLDSSKPLLIFDGDCGFCRYWQQYWQALTGDRVNYEPYQTAKQRYPDIPEEDFRKSVQYVTAGGRASGALASFLTLDNAPGGCFWLKLYRRFPFFAKLAEFAYATIAAHRPLFYRICLLLWGRNYQPPKFGLVSWLFLRGMGLIYLSAFVSFAVQAMGLIGSDGILPLHHMTELLTGHLGNARRWVVPMIFWLNDSDAAIQAVSWGGAALSLLLVFNILLRVCLILLYFFYLSLIYAGQSFMTYQWDIFLVEAGFLSILLSFSTRPGVWLLRWLLFRFMFMSGCVKLLSGDETWANLTALSYHFLTQPLPTPLGWHAAQLPMWFLKFSTGTTFFVELLLPWLIFFPRYLRFFGAAGIFLIEFLISLTGNYNFFNLQTMLMCLLLFDDAAVSHIIPQRIREKLAARTKEIAANVTGRAVIGFFAGLIVLCSLTEMSASFGAEPPIVCVAVDRLFKPFNIVNPYGLFAVMTTKREEIILEGSDDGKNWKEYEFKYKPGSLDRAPKWNIPHQPRLDWQMWFASLTDPRRLAWFPRFLKKLMDGSPEVLALIETNPFPEHPPKYIRAEFYDYTYATPAEKAKGIWWRREYVGHYFPCVMEETEGGRLTACHLFER
jgi:predicted DCC family thiol-disulfide oxidoreductase YuxK